MQPFTWHSESDEPAPTKFTEVDDRLSAAVGLRRLKAGEFLLFTGDFHNGKQLIGALARRLTTRHQPKTPLEAFRSERRMRELEHHTLSRVLVSLDRNYKLSLSRAPDVAEACRAAWGPATSDQTLVPFKALLGMLGAAEWRAKGLAVPGLKGMIRPAYGVYLPTRTDYVELLGTVGEVKGKVFDIGTGTGVLSFLLLQRGASHAIGTDIDPRAIACARENAAALGLAKKFEALETDLFPPGRADLVVCNPPWIPEAPKNRLDRAVFDADGRFLSEFIRGLPEHLQPGGTGLLLLSDLAVLLGLRSPTWLDEQLAAAGLKVKWTRFTPARHGKAKDPNDPLHAVRSKEVTTLYALQA